VPAAPDGTLGSELHGRTFSSPRLEQAPYGNPVLEARPWSDLLPALRTPESNCTSLSERERRVGSPCCGAIGWTARLVSASPHNKRLEERRPRIYETQASDGIAARYLSAVT
jgi:hypothetical protein